jgi:hypothetical protein
MLAGESKFGRKADEYMDAERLDGIHMFDVCFFPN